MLWRQLRSATTVPSITGAALRCRGLLTDDIEAFHQALDAYAEQSTSPGTRAHVRGGC